MASIYGRLLKYGEIYRVNHRKPFNSIDYIPEEDIKLCFDFSYEMAFGEGKHRSFRSGGEKRRSASEIFIDTFQGKISEFSMWHYLHDAGIITSSPDLSVEGYGKWDSFDLEFYDLHIAVKSTKHYGNLLLLETKDWNNKGEYIPNLGQDTSKFDIFVLLRIFPDGEGEMKKNKLLNLDWIEKEPLYCIIQKLQWKYDIAGYITNKDFIRLIEKNYILPQNALLNGKIKMDAENYYVQAGDMRDNVSLIKRLQERKQMFD